LLHLKSLSESLFYISKIGLEPPLRQGQTLYHFLVLQFKQDEEKELVLNIDE
jgi:structure-specific recognition protein 1